MKNISGIFIFFSLFLGFHGISSADQLTIPLPDGTMKTIEARKIYSTGNASNDLIEAVAAKDLKKINDLLQAGGDVNAAGTSGTIPLFEALDSDKSEILDLLLSHGADVNRTAKVVGMDMSALEVAVANGYSDAVKKLLDHGAKTEKEDMVGQTILFTAVESGNTDIIKMLVAHGADINHKNLLGDTPLSKAEAAGKTEIISMLKQPAEKK